MNNLKLSKVAFILTISFLIKVSSLYSAQEDSIIKIRLSYKIILNPDNGAAPQTHYLMYLTDEVIENIVDEMNELFASYWRGYRFELCEIKKIGGIASYFPDPGYWFNIDFLKYENSSNA